MFWRVARSLARNDCGAVIVYVALGLLVFFPMMAVAIDLTNYLKLNTELKQAADAAALAAAVDLDFTAQGLIDADNAARTAVQNFETGANDSGGSDVQIVTVQFLRALPPAGNSNYNDYVTTDPAKARYVRVITETRQRDSVAFRAFAALFNSLKPARIVVDAAGAVKTTAADAVAGKVTVACKAMPIFMCNPAELESNPTCGNPNVTGGQSYSLFSDFLATHPEWRRREFRVKWIGPQTAIEPGVFGLLQPITGSFNGNGANAIAHELGMVDPTTCVVIQDNDLDVKTGQTQAIVDGLNTRFDIYRGTFGSTKNDAGYAPALNRTKGALPASLGGGGGACDPQEMTSTPPQVMKLPQDSCFASNPPPASCAALGGSDPYDPQGNYAGRYGDGQWNALTYFDVNHPRTVNDTPTPWTAGDLDPILQWIHANYGNDYVAAGGKLDTGPINTVSPPSRWSVYRWETAGSSVGEARIPGEPLPPNTGFQDRIPGAHTRLNVITKEEGRSGVNGNGGAQCSNSSPLGPARRTLNVAVVNCCEQADQLSSGQRRVKITEWAEVFMTEPAKANNSGGNTGDLGAIYIEVYNAVKANDSYRVVLRDYVQLY